ncbi:hypothetical protein ACJ73_03549, partial [Blastomyces percursus]
MGDLQGQRTTPAPSGKPEDVHENEITLSVHHRGKEHAFSLPPTSTLQDLSVSIAEQLSIPPANQKLLISPKPGMQRHPFQPILLTTLPYFLPRFKITLLGSTTAEVNSIKDAAPSSPRPLSSSNIKPAK